MTAIYRGRMSEVEGWFSGLDADLFEAVNAAQGAAGVTGDILEIGAFDDYRALHTPGVAAAVWQACADVHLPLVPLVLSDGKLYGTFSAHLGVDLRRQLQASTISFDVIPFGDREVLRARRLSAEQPMTRQRIVRALTPPAVHAISRRLRGKLRPR